MTKLNLAKKVSFAQQNAIIPNKISNETMQKLGQISRRMEKNFGTEDTINQISAEMIRISSSKFRSYELKRITNTNDLSSTINMWKRKKQDTWTFPKTFLLKWK